MRDARRAVLAAALLGQAAAWVAGVLPAAAAPPAALLLVAAARLAERGGSSAGPVLRRAANVLAVLACALAVPVLQSGGAPSLREVLGPLLVAVQVVQALTWGERRGVQTGLGVAAGLMVLGASYAPDVLVGLPLLLGWVAGVVALVLLAAERSRESVDAVGEPAGTARVPLLPVTALAVVLGLLGFLLLPVSEDEVRRGRSGVGAVLSQRALTWSSDRMDLRARGNLSERVLAEVPDDGTELWRSGSYSTWDGVAWTSPELREQALPGPPFVLPDAPDGATTRASVDLLGGRGTVWSPGLASVVDTDVPGARTDGSGTVRLPWQAASYVVDSVPLEADPAVLRAAGPGPADERWLQLPADLPDRVRRLAEQITAGAPTTYDKVLAVEAWLQASATYRLDSPVPGPGEDAVDRFLFVDLTGFCEQFAAAETVLLRAVGIPARLAVGLAYGEPVGAGRRVFRESMLHAWVEVSYAGVGWAASDPTAGVARARVQPSLRSALAAKVTSALAVVDEFPGGRAAAGLAVLAALGAGIVVRRQVASRRDAPDRDGPPLGAGPPEVAGRPALTAFLTWDARQGAAGRAPSETLGELRRRLDAAPSLHGALAVVEQECFSAVPPVPADTQVAVAALEPR